MRLVLLVLVLSLTSCGARPLQPYPDKDCRSACLRLSDLECSEGDPSPIKGVPCETWCSQQTELEYLASWAPCVSQAGDVETVRACGVRCTQ